MFNVRSSQVIMSSGPAAKEGDGLFLAQTIQKAANLDEQKRREPFLSGIARTLPSSVVRSNCSTLAAAKPILRIANCSFRQEVAGRPNWPAPLLILDRHKARRRFRRRFTPGTITNRSIRTNSHCLARKIANAISKSLRSPYRRDIVSLLLAAHSHSSEFQTPG